MNKVVSKDYFSENVVRLEIEAPRIAKARRAGHFVILRVDEKGERILLPFLLLMPQKVPSLLWCKKWG